MQGYIKIPKELLSLSLDGKAIKCYCYILGALCANRGRAVKLSTVAISYRTGLSESSTRRALKDLCAKDLILRSKTYIGRVRKADRFRLGSYKFTQKGFILLDVSLLSRFGAEKLHVYLSLCSHANIYGFTYISERKLAIECGLSRNTIRKYTAELEREHALERYARFYQKHKETRAMRCFAYRIGDVKDIIDVKDITAPSEDIIYSFVSAPVYLLSYVSLHPERVIPLRVPP